NDADAEDVTQDVLLQVVRKLDTFRGEADFATWLHRVTVNMALAHREKRAYREHHEVHDPLEQFQEDGHHTAPVRPWALPPDRHDHVKRHLLLCPACVVFIETYKTTVQLTRQLPPQPLPPHLVVRLHAALGDIQKGQQPPAQA